MDIQFIDPVPAVLEEVKNVTGKGIEFIAKENLATYAALKMARKDMPSHLIYYKKEHDEIINHLIVHECGHVFRIFKCPENQRLMPYSDHQFPTLRPLQLKSLKKQHSESVEGLTETVHRMTPQTILLASNVMNYTFFRILGLHIGQNFVREYSSTKYLGKGKELASITERNYTDTHEGDNMMIDKWAAFVNISEWFKWRGFEDVPPNYGQTE